MYTNCYSYMEVSHLTLRNNDSYVVRNTHTIQMLGLHHISIESDDLISINGCILDIEPCNNASAPEA